MKVSNIIMAAVVAVSLMLGSVPALADHSEAVDKTKWKMYTVTGADKADKCTVYHVLTKNGKPYSVEPDSRCGNGFKLAPPVQVMP